MMTSTLRTNTKLNQYTILNQNTKLNRYQEDDGVDVEDEDNGDRGAHHQVHRWRCKCKQDAGQKNAKPRQHLRVEKRVKRDL